MDEYKKGTTAYHHYRLAWLYAKGRGVPKDETLAQKHLREAKKSDQWEPMEGGNRAYGDIAAP